ncbi:unnamed protein product [Paramecium primaurelia]|uniref:Thymidine kinase n=1 Tax=Paramecium primaurelia TaxID=5886 RepID=A0A8S1MRT0_PARPR|nr:unnamed protein product [Paramecium primaurelia]
MFTGTISVIYGPMFSGKTSELMRLVKRFTISERKCVVLNYANDNRYSDDQCISSHDKQYLKAIKVTKLFDAFEKCKDYDVVAIDEGQFFSDIVEFSEAMANLGKIVIVAALDGTFDRKPFRNILSLIPLAERITKLTAVCWFCKKENASFTKRTIQSQEIELIGGEDCYKPACRACFNLTENQFIKHTLPQIPIYSTDERLFGQQNLIC